MWFEVLNWLSEQEDATTVAELQEQVDALIRLGRQDAIYQVVLIIAWMIVVLAFIWWLHGQDRKIRRLEALLKTQGVSAGENSI
jgi:hypothetical protein